MGHGALAYLRQTQLDAGKNRVRIVNKKQNKTKNRYRTIDPRSSEHTKDKNILNKTPTHLICEVLKNKDKEKILKAGKEKRHTTQKVTKVRFTTELV